MKLFSFCSISHNLKRLRQKRWGKEVTSAAYWITENLFSPKEYISWQQIKSLARQMKKGKHPVLGQKRGTWGSEEVSDTATALWTGKMGVEATAGRFIGGGTLAVNKEKRRESFHEGRCWFQKNRCEKTSFCTNIRHASTPSLTEEDIQLEEGLKCKAYMTSHWGWTAHPLHAPVPSFSKHCDN